MGHDAEAEVVRLKRVLIGSPDFEEGVESQSHLRLTRHLLAEHNSKKGRQSVQGCDGPAAEVLQWKRLVKQSEKRQDREDAAAARAMNVTKAVHAASETKHNFKYAAQARTDQMREARGTLGLGCAAV